MIHGELRTYMYMIKRKQKYNHEAGGYVADNYFDKKYCFNFFFV